MGVGKYVMENKTDYYVFPHYHKNETEKFSERAFIKYEDVFDIIKLPFNSHNIISTYYNILI